MFPGWSDGPVCPVGRLGVGVHVVSSHVDETQGSTRQVSDQSRLCFNLGVITRTILSNYCLVFWTKTPMSLYPRKFVLTTLISNHVGKTSRQTNFFFFLIFGNLKYMRNWN